MSSADWQQFCLGVNVLNVFTFLLQNVALWEVGLVHCGICATGPVARCAVVIGSANGLSPVRRLAITRTKV